MTKREWTALGVVLGLILATAVLLVQIGTTHRLGEPGLKLSSQPTYDTNGIAIRAQSVPLPDAIAGFAAESVGIDPLEASWLPTDTLFGRKQYIAEDGLRVLASVVLMGTDRTSIHKPQFCLDGQGWKIEKTETAVIPMAQPHPYDLRVMRLTTSKPGRGPDGSPTLVRGIYVYWFVSDKLLTPYHGERMWWMARELVKTGLLQRWGYVTYFTVCWPGQEDATFDRMKQLIAASVPEFQTAAGPRSGVGPTAAAIRTDSKEND